MADIMNQAKRHALKSIQSYMKDLEAKRMKEPSPDDNMEQADFHNVAPDKESNDYEQESSAMAASEDVPDVKESQESEGLMDHRPAPQLAEEDGEGAEPSESEVEPSPEPASGLEAHDEDDSWKRELISHYDSLSKKVEGTGNMGTKELRKKGY